MNTQFYHFMNAVLLSRLVYLFKDQTISRRRLYVMLAIQVLGFMWYEITWMLGGLILSMAVLTVVFYILEHRAGRLEGVRMASLTLSVIVGSVVFSPWMHLGFNQVPGDLIRGLKNYSLLLGAVDGVAWERYGCLIMGGLLILNEVNLPLRSLLSRLRLAPLPEEQEPVGEHALNEKEYNTGRVIGMLERTIIYVAVLNNDIAAIGLVLAAKGFTRFKELENRRFAEYVLIGTLLSAFLAVAVAFLAKTLSAWR